MCKSSELLLVLHDTSFALLYPCKNSAGIPACQWFYSLPNSLAPPAGSHSASSCSHFTMPVVLAVKRSSQLCMSKHIFAEPWSASHLRNGSRLCCGPTADVFGTYRNWVQMRSLTTRSRRWTKSSRTTPLMLSSIRLEVMCMRAAASCCHAPACSVPAAAQGLDSTLAWLTLAWHRCCCFLYL